MPCTTRTGRSDTLPPFQPNVGASISTPFHDQHTYSCTRALLSCHDLIDDLHERHFFYYSPFPIYPYFHISYCLNVSLFNVGWHLMVLWGLDRVGTEMYGLSFFLSRKCMHGHGALVKKIWTDIPFLLCCGGSAYYSRDLTDV